LNQPPYGRQSPDGWPETASAWLNVGSMMKRTEIISAVAHSDLPSIPVEQWSEWKTLSTANFNDQLNGVIGTLLNGQASLNTRKVMESARPGAGAGSGAEERKELLRELIMLALVSPEFQRR
jgi:hypothetical protein